MNLVIGIDFGTDSVRSVIVNTKNGEELSSYIHHYKHWKKGDYSNPSINSFRQHPNDYLEGIEITIINALASCPEGTAEQIKGISVDTTGSTIVPVNEEGIPLSLIDGFKENPNAMFILWKDHTAIKEANEITQYAKNWSGEDYTKYCGGVYSSEWFWAKMLHVLRNDKEVREEAFSWVEHCDWIVADLCGDTNPLTLKRSRCAAGHKAMWHEDFDGLPSEEFLTGVDPLLKGIRNRLYSETYTADTCAGNLSVRWAEKLGLSTNVVIGVGSFDAHVGAVGGQIEPYILSKVIGTSTCDMLIAPSVDIGNKTIEGICGQVNGSITPSMIGLEAGQSAFGDIYAWFKNLLSWPLLNVPNINHNEIIDSIIPELVKQAEELPIEVDSAIISADWMNGRRTPFANQELKGAIAGLTLGSDAPRIFKSLVEATAFGAKKIVDSFVDQGVRIDGVIALGGIPRKSDYVVQVLADVLNMEIKVAASEQTCALGAAMFASVIAEIYPNIKEAQDNMGAGFDKIFKPKPENVEKYKEIYNKYCILTEHIETTI